MARGYTGWQMAASGDNYVDSLHGAPLLSFYKAFVAADDATALDVVADLPFKIRVIDAIVVCTTAAAGGTLTVRNGSNAITDAIACATDEAIDRATTIDNAYAEIDKGGSLKVITANSAIGYVQIHAVRAV